MKDLSPFILLLGMFLSWLDVMLRLRNEYMYIYLFPLFSMVWYVGKAQRYSRGTDLTGAT